MDRERSSERALLNERGRVDGMVVLCEHSHFSLQLFVLSKVDCLALAVASTCLIPPLVAMPFAASSADDPSAATPQP